MIQLILGTTSQGRKDLFEQLGVNFISKGSNIDEYFENRPQNPKDLCLALSKLKAENVAQSFSEGLVLGFDTVALFENTILEKPKSRKEQYERLKRISGKKLEVYTGIYIIDIKGHRSLSKVISTEAHIRDLKENEINNYLNTDSNYDKFTLGFDPLNSLSSTFTRNINGSYLNYIRGIPLEAIIEMLYEFDFKL